MNDHQKELARKVFDQFDADHSGTVESKGINYIAFPVYFSEFEKMVRELHVFENESLVDVYAGMVFKVMAFYPKA